MKLFAFLLSLSGATSYANNPIRQNLQKILTELRGLESPYRTVEAYGKWVQTDAGREGVSFLAEHYEELRTMGKQEVVKDLAETGAKEVTPLVKKALADPQGEELPRYLYRSSYRATPEFRKEVAPSLILWLKNERAKEYAIQLLPRYDGALAAERLFTDEFLSPTAKTVPVVLKSCREARLAIPLTRIRPLLEAWQSKVLEDSTDSWIIQGYAEALITLAVYEPQEALSIAVAVVERKPSRSEQFYEVPLAAAGLMGLYEALLHDSNDDARFKRLPEPAQIYFAVTLFEADSENGGIGQALENSTGDYLPLVRKGYREIGATRDASYLEAMLAPFGKEGPSSNREKRKAQMEAMKPDYWEQEEALGEKWSQSNGEGGRISTLWLLNRWVVRHADVLKPLVKK